MKVKIATLAIAGLHKGSMICAKCAPLGAVDLRGFQQGIRDALKELAKQKNVVCAAENAGTTRGAMLPISPSLFHIIYSGIKVT